MPPSLASVRERAQSPDAHRLGCILLSASVLTALCGCALVTRGMQQRIRVDAVSREGKAMEAVDCRPGNDSGSGPDSSAPTQSLKVTRSVDDLLINCVSHGQVVARAKVISRADLAMASLVAPGGVISVTIDHLSGAAYDYPDWITLVAGEERIFDRKDSAQGPLAGTFSRLLDPAAGIGMLADPPLDHYRAGANVSASDAREPGARRTGRETYNVEKLAATMNCGAKPRAVLVERGGGFERHRVPCTSGPDLLIRCEFGNCRVQPAGAQSDRINNANFR